MINEFVIDRVFSCIWTFLFVHIADTTIVYVGYIVCRQCYD